MSEIAASVSHTRLHWEARCHVAVSRTEWEQASESWQYSFALRAHPKCPGFKKGCKSWKPNGARPPILKHDSA